MTLYKIGKSNGLVYLTYNINEAKKIVPHFDEYDEVSDYLIERISLVELKTAEDFKKHPHSVYFKLDLKIFDSNDFTNLDEVGVNFHYSKEYNSSNNVKYFNNDKDLIEAIDDMDYDAILANFQGVPVILTWRLLPKHYQVDEKIFISTIKI